MAPLEGIDTASSTIGHLDALRQAGVRFVCRYIAPPGPSYDWKRVSKAEADAIRAAKLGLVLVFESGADRALGGSAAGRADGAFALAMLADLGLHDSPVYFAVDFDAQPAQLGAVVAYIEGAASIVGKGRTGVYGGLRAVQATAQACRYAWQTYAWSGGQWSPRAQLRQYQNGVTIGGLSCDRDRAMVADYGQTAKPRRLVGWTVEYTTRAGKRATANLGTRTRLGRRQPDSWVARHHPAFTRGRVDFMRRYDGG